MVSVQLAFRIWIMWCRGQALTPWGAGLGAQLQRTPHRDPWVRGRWEPLRFSRLDHWECGGCFPHQLHTSVCERKLAKFFKKQWKGGWWVGWRGGGIGMWNIEGEAEATTMIVAELWHCITANHNACSVREKERGKKKKKKEKEAAADLPFKKVWGDNKYPNDSSVPLYPRLKLTRGPNVECQQQTQRSEQWGAEAASTAWLNGAGDFPSPALPSRHSQSLLGKKWRPSQQARQPVNGRARSLSGTMHYSHAPLRH